MTEEYVESKQDQEVMEMAYRLLHEFGWTSDIHQSKNEFYYTLQGRVEKYRTTGGDDK